MFDWFKKLRSGPRRAEPPGDPSPALEPSRDQDVAVQETEDKRPRRTVTQVFEAFYEQNPEPTPYGIHALLEAGAADLEDYRQVLEVCTTIKNHCNMDPISPSLKKKLANQELLAFLRWHEANDIAKEEYRDGTSIEELVLTFRADTVGHNQTSG